jgi:carboxyl-terminal processing protease
VHSRLLEPGYGYVRISSFQERTGSDLRKALATLKEEEDGPLRGLVLDLRDNPGGLLAQAVNVVDLWLTEGLVVYTKGRVEREELEYYAENNGTEPFYPMVILINAGSASASEIVAGALQDHNRALVLGTQSFGKGSVQTVYRMADGSGVKITTALYYTPAGRSIQEVGIAPDIVVEATRMVPTTPPRHYQRAREKDLQGHFTQEDAKDEKEKDVQEEGEDVGEKAAKDLPDPQLGRSLEVLKSWIYFDRFQVDPMLSEVEDDDESEAETTDESEDDERG